MKTNDQCSSKATSCEFLSSAVGPGRIVGRRPLFAENNVITATVLLPQLACSIHISRSLQYSVSNCAPKIDLLPVPDGVFRTVHKGGRVQCWSPSRTFGTAMHQSRSPSISSTIFCSSSSSSPSSSSCRAALSAIWALALSTFISAGSDLPPCSLTSELGMVRSTATARRALAGREGSSPPHHRILRELRKSNWC